PFLDAPGVLDDGASYYYLVDDSSGAPVQISVHKNLATRSVLIAFNDGDPASANADPALSSVVADRTSLPADGFTQAAIVVVPRDSSGTPLGTGLTVTVDVAALQPGFLS